MACNYKNGHEKNTKNMFYYKIGLCPQNEDTISKF